MEGTDTKTECKTVSLEVKYKNKTVCKTVSLEAKYRNTAIYTL